MSSETNEKRPTGITKGRLLYDLGAHTQFDKNIHKTCKTSIDYGMYSTQFFLGSPQSFERHTPTFDDIINTKTLLKRFPMNVFTHFPYVANFAGSVDSIAWEDDANQNRKTSFVIQNLSKELEVVSNFWEKGKKSGVVIHPGSFKDRQKGLQTIAQSINKVKFVENSKLILENSAGQGSSLATTLDEIKEILRYTNPEIDSHIGVCIDTAHIFGYGEYDIRETKEVDRLFLEFDEKIGMNKFELCHLNDSEVCLGSKKDRHACLGTGWIWNESFTPLIHLLNKCKENNIPMVLETHGLDMLTVANLNEYSD